MANIDKWIYIYIIYIYIYYVLKDQLHAIIYNISIYIYTNMFMSV